MSVFLNSGTRAGKLLFRRGKVCCAVVYTATAVLSVYLPYALRAHCNVARLGSHNTGKNNKLPIDANEFKVYQQ